MLTAGQAVYTELKNLCIWNKNNAGMGTFYRSKHELVFVWKNGTAPHINTFELGQYPELVAAAVALWKKWQNICQYKYLLIEDKGSGTSLIQSLKKQSIFAHQHHAKIEGDKIMRLTAQAAQFHAGAVHFREDAPWLGDLMLELLGFPGVRHDDQVDSISQALAFVGWKSSQTVIVSPLRI
jgi:predicted phage terminase large subunit-like protein